MYQLHTGFVRIFRVREAKAWVWPMLEVLFAFPCGGSIGCVESSRVQGGEGVKWQMATPPSLSDCFGTFLRPESLWMWPQGRCKTLV